MQVDNEIHMFTNGQGLKFSFGLDMSWLAFEFISDFGKKTGNLSGHFIDQM